MRKFFLLLMLGIVLSSVAQKPQTRMSPRAQTQKPQSSQKSQRTQKPQKSQRAQQPQRTQKSQKSQRTQPPQSTQKQQLQAQQQQLKKNIAANKRQKAELEQKVKKQLEEAFILGTEIDEQKRVIDTIRVSLDSLDQQIAQLGKEKAKLEGELRDRQARYASSVRYMHRNRRMQSRMMFIFSAKNINQMYRRTRFMNEYSTYQRAQGEAVKQKQTQVDQKQQEITQVRDARKALLTQQEKERQTLQQQQDQKQQMAKELQKQQRTVTALIDQQQKEEARINAEIDRIIAEEIAREQARLEAERKRKEEQARLERERQERERQAREKEKEQKKQEKRDKKQDKTIEKQVRKETKEMARRESQSSSSSQRSQSSQQSQQSYLAADPDAHLTGSFASNKGRLPMPITGAYQMVRGFGDNVVDGTRGVHLASKGIYLKGQPGAKARCVFDGEVSKIFNTGSSYVVMVRHGRFISVYSDIASVSVKAGQRVSTSQILGNLGPNSVMQFQLRNWTELLNPRLWLKKTP